MLSEKYKRVLANTISLSILQGSNYLLPLILLPILIQRLGIENFGLISLAIATIAFFRAIVSYGFDLSGTKQVSLTRNNTKRLSKVFFSIMFVKFILTIITLLILILMINTIELFKNNAELFYLTYLIVISDALFPLWFFQGIEKMKFITYLRILHKLILLVCILLYIDNSTKYLLVPIFDFSSALLSSILSLIIIYRTKKIRIYYPSYIDIKYQLFRGFHIFLSKFSIQFYTNINILFLGFYSNNEIVGEYSIAHKIYGALRGISEPVSQALFPYLSNTFRENKIQYYKIIKKISIIYIIFLFSLGSISYYFSSELIYLISGKNLPLSTEILQVFSISIFFAIGGLYTYLLVIKNKSIYLSKITIISVIINSLLLFPVVFYYGVYGVVFLFLFLQIVQASLQLFYNKEIWSYK